MTAYNQEIRFGVTGQTLVWDAPEGRASSVTDVQVWQITTGDTGTEEAATTGTASIDAVNTTFDANSGVSSADPKLCNLAATTSIVAEDPQFPGRFRSYLATDSVGRKEWITVVGITSAASVRAAFPLLLDYVNANAFVGTRLSIAVDPTWVADAQNITDGGGALSNLFRSTGQTARDPNPGYRVLWTYVVSSVTYRHYTYFDLVRQVGEHSVTPGAMEAFYPGWTDRLPTYHRDDQGRRLIEEAYTQVKWDLHQSGQPDQTLRNREGVNELVKHKAREMHEMGNANGSGMLELFMRSYQSRLDQLVRVGHMLTSTTDSTGVGVRVSAISVLSK